MSSSGYRASTSHTPSRTSREIPRTDSLSRKYARAITPLGAGIQSLSEIISEVCGSQKSIWRKANSRSRKSNRAAHGGIGRTKGIVGLVSYLFSHPGRCTVFGGWQAGWVTRGWAGPSEVSHSTGRACRGITMGHGTNFITLKSI